MASCGYVGCPKSSGYCLSLLTAAHDSIRYGLSLTKAVVPSLHLLPPLTPGQQPPGILSTGQARRHPSAGVMERRGHGHYGRGLSHLRVSSEVSQGGPVGHSLGTESAHFHSHLALEPFFPDLR